MKKHLSFFLCLVFLALILVTAVAYNSKKPRVMILQSYEPGYAWTRDVDEGLNRIIRKWTGYSVTWHYMNTKQHSDPEWLNRSGIIARRAIKQTNPKVLIAVDDLAQSLAAKHFINDPNMEIVFAGVNGSVEPYGYDKANNVTGVFEHKQLRPIKEAILALESKKLTPNPFPSLVYILDPSPSLGRGKGNIDRYDWSPIAYKGSIVAKDYPDWKKIILEQGEKVDYIIVANYRKLATSGPGTSYASPEEVMTWTDRQSKVPVIGINSFNVEDGAMISIGVSPFEQGEVAAKMAQMILEDNIRANTIPMKENQQYIVAIREASLQLRNMELPAIYEAFGRATENFIE
jgi:ABC-type uncharacterized transport system substrate-binding protein